MKLIFMAEANELKNKANNALYDLIEAIGEKSKKFTDHKCIEVYPNTKDFFSAEFDWWVTEIISVDKNLIYLVDKDHKSYDIDVLNYFTFLSLVDYIFSIFIEKIEEQVEIHSKPL